MSDLAKWNESKTLDVLMREQTLELLRQNAELRNELRKCREEHIEIERRLVEVEAGSQRDRESRRAALNLMEDAVSARRAEERESLKRRLAEEKLREADRRKDEFLAILAHELRNPLATIKGGVQLLQSDAVQESTRAAALPIVAEQVEHMNRLVDDLLDVARMRQGIIEIRRRPAILQTVLRNAFDMSDRFIKEKHCSLEIRLPADDIRLDADASRLVQVFANLLTNSAKYSGAGCRIEVSAERRESGAEVRVKDHGQGISPELLPYIFDPFVQSVDAVGGYNGGLGLGLSVARKLVELHGGQIEAISEGVGKGSQFVVLLPVAEVDP